MPGNISCTSDDAARSLPRKIRILRIDSERSVAEDDFVAAEEPLDIRISFYLKEKLLTESVALTMRTPGADSELVAGLLFSEGVITRRDDLIGLRHLGAGPQNEMLAELSRNVDVDAWRLRRNSMLNSSCGICGKTSLEQIIRPFPLPAHEHMFDADILFGLPQSLADQQRGFAETGSLHAAALVNTKGEIERLFEDVGRHNALDKLVGWCLLNNRLPLDRQIVFLTSRSSFELVQKTAMAGGMILATVGGPSSLAIETARALNLTLAGFVRNGRCNVYSCAWRIHSK